MIATLVLLLLAGSAIADLNDLCSTDADCKSSNQYCSIPAGLTPACVQGYCVCNSCYMDDGMGNCTQIPLTRPCACPNDSSCHDSCDVSQPFPFIFPENVQCQGVTAVCDGCSVFNNQTGVCDRTTAPVSRGANCSDVCDCRADQNLNCIPKGVCACSLGSQFDETGSGCFQRQYGDACVTGDDCGAYYGNGPACNAGKCGCRSQPTEFDPMSYVATQYSYADPTGMAVSQMICVANTSMVGLKVGALCTRDPLSFAPILCSESEDSGESGLVNGTLAICNAGLICSDVFMCENGISSFGSLIGVCRQINKPITLPSPTKASCPSSSSSQLVTNATSLYSNPCNTTADCGINEFCFIPDVVPPCSSGYCICQQCFVYDGDYCQPALFLSMGDNCTGSANEILANLTSCNNGLVGITPATPNGLGPGEACQDSGQCSGGMICEFYSTPTTTCDCEFEYRWDPTSSTCVQSKVGDNCESSVECYGSLTCGSTSPTSSEFVCQAMQPEPFQCNYCPEDSNNPNATCRTGNVQLNGSTMASLLDLCFPGWASYVVGIGKCSS